MPPMVLMFGCVAFVAAVRFSPLCAYQCGTEQGWRAFLRNHAEYQQKPLAINAGQTLVAVLELTRGSESFLRNNEEAKQSYEELRSMPELSQCMREESRYGNLLQDVGAGRKACPREAAHTVRQDSVVYRRLYHGLFGSQ